MDNMDKESQKHNVEIGRRLQEIRENQGYKQRQFAEYLGVTEENYRRYEAGTVRLTVDKLYTLHEKGNVDPTYLITGNRNEEFDIKAVLANGTREQQNETIKRVFEYLTKTNF
ncbi:MAG: helix-turn-helix transcriptional regulator [Lachnospiraceae bacterium]